MTVAARPQRPIPTVEASPELLRKGDMVYPDINTTGNPFRVLGPAVRATDSNGNTGWRVELEHDCVLVPDGAKVRTQRRPMPQPAPQVKSEEDWEPDTVRRRVPERRPA